MLMDTAGLLAFIFAGENLHETAVTLFESAGRKLTHNYVLAELVVPAQARKYPRRPVLGFITDLLAHPQVDVVWVDETLHREAVLFLEQRADKSYSLCDAVNFLLMRRRSINEALTTDHHFEQEGFRRLLEP
jgi:predicted nucleic acid-binding protein